MGKAKLKIGRFGFNAHVETKDADNEQGVLLRSMTVNLLAVSRLSFVRHDFARKNIAKPWNISPREQVKLAVPQGCR